MHSASYNLYSYNESTLFEDVLLLAANAHRVLDLLLCGLQVLLELLARLLLI